MEKLLNLLDANARLTTEQLAVMLDMSEAEIAAEIARLEDEGVIRGYKPLIDWEKTDRELVTAIIDLQIAPSKDKGFDALAETITAFDEVESLIGHGVGGVCPFAVNEGVRVYLDESLRRFETVFPACGSASSAIELTIPELERYSSFIAWVDVCKLPEIEK
jgi:prolyl-tRNA editing enzyme YbaK/EbsC (Cys-tRNA(Pro) deacylase)